MTNPSPVRAAARGRSIFLSSLIATLLLLAGAIMAVAAPRKTATATTSWTLGTAGTINWTQTSGGTWNGGPAGEYPGQNSDAIVTIGNGATVNITTNIPFPVELHMTGFATVNVNSPAGVLTLEASSTVTTNNTLTVNGGTLVVPNGATLTMVNGGHFDVNSGTLTNAGTITVDSNSSQMNINGGTINGAGTTQIDGVLNIFTTNNSAIVDGGQLIQAGATGSIFYSPTTSQPISINNGSKIKLASGSIMQLGNNEPVNSSGNGIIDILSGATLTKSSGSGQTTLNTIVNNAGTVNYAITAGTLALANGGTHTGNWSNIGSAGITFSGGTHNFNPGSVMDSSAVVAVTGASANVNDNNGLTFDTLNLQNGSFGGGALTSVTTFNWSGGDLSGLGSLAVSGTTTINPSTTTSHLANGRTLKVQGGGSYAPSGGGSLSVEGLMQTSALFGLQGSTINAIGTTGKIQVVSGTLANKVSSIDIYPFVQVDNGATLNANYITLPSAVVALRGGMTAATGCTLTVPFNTSLDLNNTSTTPTYTFSPSIFYNVTGKLRVLGSSAVNLGGTSMGVSNFAQAGTSTISGPGSITVSGNYAFSGGTLNAGAVGTVTGGAATMTIQPTNNITLSGATLNTTGGGAAVSYTPSTGIFTLNNTSHLNIYGSGDSLTINGTNPTINSDGTSDIGVVAGATLNVPATGTTTLTPNLLTSGTTNITGGTVDLTNGCSLSGAVVFGSASNALELVSGTGGISAGATFTGGGIFRLNGGSLVAPTTPYVMGVNFEQSSPGQLNLGADFQFGSGRTYKWHGGLITTFQAGGQLTIASGATLDLTSLTAAAMLTAPLVNAGTTNYAPGVQQLTVAGTTITNSGTFDFRANGALATSGISSISNTGTFQKSTTTGVSSVLVPFTNTGSGFINVLTGTLSLDGGGSMSNGTITVGNGANLDFNGATKVFDVNNGTMTTSGTVNVRAGTLNVYVPLAMGNLGLYGGTLHSMSNSTVGGSVVWDGGTLDGGGTTTMTNPSASFTLGSTNPSMLSGGHIFHMKGSGTYNGNISNYLKLSTALFQVDSGATLTIPAQSLIDTTGSSTVANAGTMNVNAPFSISPGFDNSGTVNVNSGTLTLLLGGTETGPFNLADGTQLLLNGGTFNANSGAAFNATGGGATGSVKVAAGTFAAGTSVTAPNFIMAGGTMTGAGNLTLTGTSTWTAGSFIGTGTVTNSSGTFSINSASTLNLNRSFTNNATTSLIGSGLLSVANNAAVVNNATWSITNSMGMAGIAGTSFTNASTGTISKSSGASSLINMPFANQGTVQVTSGTALQLLQDGTHTGTFQVTNGVLQLVSGNHTFTGTSSTTGAGQFRIDSPAAATFASGATYTISGITGITGGTLSFTSAASTAVLNMNGGALQGTGNVTVAGPGPSTWLGGSMLGSGHTILAAGVTMNATSGLAAMSIGSGRTFDNNGTFNYSASTNGLSFDNGATWNNNSGAMLDLKSDLGIGSSGTAAITMTNAGTLQKSAGTGTTNIPAALNNTGTVNAFTGTLLFSNGYSQSAGTTFLGGGTLNASSAININGGQLRGNGTISSVNNVGGTVAPGDVTNTGAINVNGTFAQAAAGTTAIRLGGSAANQFDQIKVTGAASLAGNLTVTSKGGYVPTTNTTFPIMTYASRTGTFNPPTPPALGTGGAWQVNYNPTSLDLVATFTSNDIGSSLTAPAAVAHGQTFTVQAAVINLGAQTATNVTTFTTFGTGGVGGNPATIVSATAPAGVNCTTGSATVSCSMASLAPGATATITITLTASNVANLVINNSVSATEADPNTANNATSVTVAMKPGSNLAVTVTDSPDPVNAGAALIYNISVSNGGPDATNGASVIITPPSGATGVAATGSGWSCVTLSATQLKCTSSAVVNASNSYPTIGVSMNAPTSGSTATLTATASPSAPNLDPNPADDTASQSTVITPTTADLQVTKVGPGTANPGGNITFTIVVKNNGPADALNVTLDDPAQPTLTFVSATGGGCLQFPCLIGTLTSGQSVTVNATYTVAPNVFTSVTNTANATTSTNDPNPANNSASATVTINGCPDAPSNPLPANGVSNVPTSGKFQWIATGAPTYNVYLGAVGSGCSTLLASTPTNSLPYSNLQPGVTYEWRVEAVLPGCPQATTACLTFTTATNCNTAPPVAQSPAAGATVSSPVTFQWSSVTGATSYDVFVGTAGAAPAKVGSTSGTSFTTDVANGPLSWYVVANTGGGCGALRSQTINFTACGPAAAPIPAVVGEATSGQTYSLTWDQVPGASKYEVTEATNASFNNGFTQTVTGTSVSFTHQTTTGAQAFFYRVRAIADCNQQFSAYSETLRTIIIPLPAATQPPTANVPVGSTKVVVQQLFVPGAGPGNFTYSATVDKPWLTIQNPTGILPIDGVTLVITADPSNLPNGTITGTVLVTVTNLSSGKTSTNATSTTTATPVSINLVTPVSTGAPTTPQPTSLIIPSVGHLDGANSHWQSDIRVTNTSTDRQKYQLLFTPSGDDSGKPVKSTTIEVGSNDTTALDDIVRNWYGIGTLGDSANGVLEIRPLGKVGKTAVDADPVKATAVASSRTYNVSANGTLGQYIPAIPFANFVGKADPKGLQSVLSLQQIAQSEAFRTNVGLVEAGGQPVSVLLSIFDANGIRLKDIPYALKAGEQKQLNALLASQNITLADGRIEVKVTGGDGKVTAYASVVDNHTNDPLLVSGVPIGASSSDRFVLPGVGDINNALARWRSDLRVFNGGAADQLATLTFYPQVGGGDPVSKTVVIKRGEVQAFDNILASFFGVSNVGGGAVHVTTPTSSQLVVTGRTYNQTPDGTFGQFIPAVTPLEAVGKNERTLQILQVEDSVRYRTNLGLAEVSGKPVTLDVSVIIPESKVQPHLVVTLGPNEFRQSSFLKDLGLTNTYNARITVRVVDGDGRVTAYGSVVDMTTQDPTYVPAQ